MAPSFVSLGINTLDNHQGNHTHSHAFLTLKSLYFDDLALVTTMRPYLLKFKHSKNIRKCFHQFCSSGLGGSRGWIIQVLVVQKVQEVDKIIKVNQINALSWGSVAGPVIQANGRLTFEVDLRSGGPLCFTTE